MQRSYRQRVLIMTSLTDIETIRKRARENATVFKKQFMEIEATHIEYFRRLLGGPYTDDFFVRMRPGETIKANMFY